MTDPRAPERIVRRFARSSNLMIAGRPFAVTGTGADALHDLLAGLGGIPSPIPDPGRIEFDLDAEQVLLDGKPLPERGDAAGRIAFARQHMPVAAALAERLDLTGLRVGVAMVLEPKTAVLSLLLRERGAEVSVYAHPDEIDVAVADELRAQGFAVTADPALAGPDERAAALAFLRAGLDVLLDDGAHLIRLAHEDDPALVDGWIGACEETTSGLTPLRRMQDAGILRCAVMAVNDARTKTMFDNRYGTGQSCVFAIADLLEERGIALTDQPALVLGYGPVGRGVAAHLRALGVEVRVAETDPVRALEARHDGLVTGRALELAGGALVVSATGVPSTVTPEIAAVARVIAVAGGVPGEVSDAGGALVLGGGGAVNITAAEGNPIEIMDLSFAVQLAALGELLERRPEPGVHALGPEVDELVARTALAVRGAGIDPPRDLDPDGVDDWRSPRYRDSRS
ncbi:adenosylhomocysteinase [Microbacterium sp. SL75]|uniref:adenosylhomocysteinase n=1 Tax=Microbacterium sp. SL75 TaxID=2995140 RepID=UPI0022716349|nr:adenosylhomocysteinase [Microbacterium sp. SL75]WAC70180.1 adenosylhomocysteinase [Microbacterium sp. SL75]